MKVLVYYPAFTEEQVEACRKLVASLGDHTLYIATNDAEALAAAPEVDAILGHFPPAVCAAAPKLRWVQSFSTGMDKFLFPEIIERDGVDVSNVAGLYASQGGEQIALEHAVLAEIGLEAETLVDGRGERVHVPFLGVPVGRTVLVEDRLQHVFGKIQQPLALLDERRRDARHRAGA